MRNDVKGTPGQDEHGCICCGKPVLQNSGRKAKKFCSDRCRMKWWNSHLDQVKRKANYEITCQKIIPGISPYRAVTVIS